MEPSLASNLQAMQEYPAQTHTIAEEVSAPTSGMPLATEIQNCDSMQTWSTQDNNANTPLVEIKLFVGRVPRIIDEDQLRPIFETFGPVTEVAIIKDKATGQHKGSAFVRMASITHADSAIRALNGEKVLDPLLGPLQVRYALKEAEKLGLSSDAGVQGQDQVKLFVGSLPKHITESDVKKVFDPYGQVDEVFLLRDPQSAVCRGCAFVKFALKEQALNAIKNLNGVVTLPDAQRPLEVRFAENKRNQATQGNAPMMTGQNPYRFAMSGNKLSAQLPPSNLNPRIAGPWKEYFSPDNRPYYHNEIIKITQWEKPAEFVELDAATSTARTDITGPPGANIFVFHIPNDWTQNDLIQNFCSFGKILSAHIATDKTTGRKKGYAFVSYDNIASSVNAVMTMNGFLASGKRLKVSIKQHEDQYVAHLLPPTNSPPMDQPGQMMQLGRGPNQGLGAQGLSTLTQGLGQMGHPVGMTPALAISMNPNAMANAHVAPLTEAAMMHHNPSIGFAPNAVNPYGSYAFGNAAASAAVQNRRYGGGS